MDITLQTDILKKNLSCAQTLCQKKTVNDITQNVLFLFSEKFCSLKATDLEAFLQLSFVVTSISDFLKEESFLVNAKRFFDLIKDIQTTYITLAVKNNCLNISLDDVDISLATISATDFPMKESLTVVNLLSIINHDLMEIISYCLPLAGTSGSIATGSGAVLLQFNKDSIKATTTDGHCLAHISIQTNTMLQEPVEFILSKKAIADIKKILECEDSSNMIVIGKSSEGEIALSAKDFTLHVRPLNEKFPNYNKIINLQSSDKASQTLSFITTDIAKSFKRLNCLTAGKFIPASLLCNNSNKLTVKIENKEIGNAKENIYIQEFFNNNVAAHESIDVALFPGYVLNAVNAVGEKDRINIVISGRKNPVLFSNFDPERQKIYVVMPMAFS